MAMTRRIIEVLAAGSGLTQLRNLEWNRWRDIIFRERGAYIFQKRRDAHEVDCLRTRFVPMLTDSEGET